MATRCQILVEGLKASLYRHYDGYPAAMIPDIQAAITSFGDRGWDDEELLGHLFREVPHCKGICDEFHGDEEYIYIVRQDWSIEVRVPHPAFWNDPFIEYTRPHGAVAPGELGMNPHTTPA